MTAGLEEPESPLLVTRLSLPAGKDTKRGVSPMATGPAGPWLEAHVGAQYLLPLLQSGEPRGMPGMRVTSVQFQRAGMGSPLDDVIVLGHDAKGIEARLQIQVKRSIEFTLGDPNFRSVVAMACRAAAAGFGMGGDAYAVAVGNSSRIDRHIQAVLNWARQYQDSETFHRRLKKEGEAHKEMRKFVAAFTEHMQAAGAAYDDSSVHQLLRRFLVLVFDAEQPGSVSNTLARDRCLALLAPLHADRAADLWTTLGQIALTHDAVGGDIDATRLRELLTSEHSFQLAGDRRLRDARDRVAEQADHALADISTNVHGVHLDREHVVSAALSALQQGRYLELRGMSGVGKSGVLKVLALQVLAQSRAIVLSPHRVAPGGWAAMASQLGCNARVEEFLADLAGDGGAILFVDGIDRFDNLAQRATVQDLIRGAAKTPGFKVVATARMDFDAHASAWLPSEAMAQLGRAPPIVVETLIAQEVALLGDESPALLALLRPGHPAESLVRNLYRLERLSHSPAALGQFYSEAQMAHDWWTTGDSVNPEGRVDRQRILHDMAVRGLTGSAPTDLGSRPSAPLEQLVASRSLRTDRVDYYEFTHDVLLDWAVGCLLYEEPGRIVSLALDGPVPVHLGRGLELAARLHVERHENISGWQRLLVQVSAPGVHGSWKRTVLLALSRTERATESLTRCLPALFADDAALLRELIGAAVTVDARSAAEIWTGRDEALLEVAKSIVVPNGPSWKNLVLWTLAVAARLPRAAAPGVIDLYGRWSMAYAGKDVLSPLLVTQLHKWLVEVESIQHPSGATYKERRVASEQPGLTLGSGDESSLRQNFLMWCSLQPALADAYLKGLASHRNNDTVFRELIGFTGSAAAAAPRALADLFLAGLTQHEKDDRHTGRPEVFSYWDNQYYPASPARVPFHDLLRVAPAEGLRLVRSVVGHSIRRRTRARQPDPADALVIPFPQVQRAFPWPDTYSWARESNSSIVTSALMALEAWSHQRVEAGEAMELVLQDILGPEGSPAAFLLVAVDVLLSHWPASRDLLWPFAASARLLATDRERHSMDTINRNAQVAWVKPEPRIGVSLESLTRRASRRWPLDSMVEAYGRDGPEHFRSAMRETLAAQMKVLGAPGEDSYGYSDPRLAALSAFNQLGLANYDTLGTDANGKPIVQYVTPASEEEIVRRIRERAQPGQEEFLVFTDLTMAIDGDRVEDARLERALVLQADPMPDGDDPLGQQKNRWRLAALLLRDGSDMLRDKHGAWARDLLAEAADHNAKDVHSGSQIAYNPLSIAAVGLLADFRRGNAESLRSLLALAVKDRVQMAAVVLAELKRGQPIAGDLARSLVRLGLASEIHAVGQRASILPDSDWKATQESFDKERDEANRAKADAAVTAELEWFSGSGPEPQWPILPAPRPPRKRRPADTESCGWPEPSGVTFEFDDKGGAVWLALAAKLWAKAGVASHLRSLLEHCWPWTAGANGVGMSDDEEAGERSREWNSAYFSAAVKAAATLQGKAWQDLLFDRVQELPDDAFLDASESVLLQIDILWIDEGRLTDSQVLHARQLIVDRLRASRSWKWLVSRPSHSVDLKIAGGLATVFVGTYQMSRGPMCYLTAVQGHRTSPLLPLLTELTQEGAASTFVAMGFLGLIEVAPRLDYLPFLWATTLAWWKRHGTNPGFWHDHGVGRRVCAWVETVLSQPHVALPSHRDALIGISDTLLKCGITQAKPLEDQILELLRES